MALDRPVAIKLLAPSLTVDREARERFLSEARAAARLSHPHIVPIHSVEVHGDVVFFVMSFIDGESLGQRVRRAGPLPRVEASRLMQEVAWALGMAHALGIVHRDIKPDNVMLERGTGRALLMDFGIASLADPDRARPGVAGTPHYMSPEQGLGDPVDGRSDLYSLGATTYVAVTGERPFEDPPDPRALLAGTQAFAPVTARRPDLPAGFVTAIHRCLAPRPEDRFATAGELSAALTAARPSGDETAVPVAGWVRDAQAAGAEIGTAVVTAATSAGVMGVIGFEAMAGWVFYPIAALLTGMGLFRFGDLVMRTRQLRLQGYGLASVRPALVLEERRAKEEAVLVREAPGGPLDRPGVLLAAGIAKTALAALLLINGDGWLAIVGAAGTVLFPAGTIRQLAQRSHRGRTFWSRWLGGRLGRFLFWVAGRWPGSRRLPAPDAPTAVLLGGAADQLYAALPPDRRAMLQDLPSLVRRLEADALAAGDADPARRSEALLALEALRLDLLRMQAGQAVGDQLTADLDAARRLAARMDRSLAAGNE